METIIEKPEKLTTYIYILKCPKTNEIKYVGKSNNPTARYRNHLREECSASIHKINWVKKLAKENLIPILEIIEEVQISEWKEKERFYIDKFLKEGNKLTNICSGGEGLTFGNQTSFKKGNIPWNNGTANIYKKICPVCGNEFSGFKSEIDKYTCCSRKCRKVNSKNITNTGRFDKGSTPWNKGIKNYNLNNPNNSTQVIQLKYPSLEKFNEFPSLAEAERNTKISQDSIQQVLSFSSKTAGGYSWIRKFFPKKHKKILIGIMGYARSGKDTYADLLKEVLFENGFESQKFSLATPIKKDLKKWIKKLFKIDINNCSNNEKEIVRPFMVAYGEARRKQSNGMFFILKLQEEIKNFNKICIIPDVRFENESKFIKDNYGILIHLEKKLKNGEILGPPNDQEKLNDPIIRNYSDISVVWDESNDREYMKEVVLQNFEQVKYYLNN